MNNVELLQAAEKRRDEYEARALAATRKGNQKEADSLLPYIHAARKEINLLRARAMVINAKPGDLWELAAQALTRQPVKIYWQRTQTGALANAIKEGSDPAYIEIDDNTVDVEAIYKVFLHEVGHVLDYTRRDPTTTTEADREEMADFYAANFGRWAKNNGHKYAANDRSNLECLLRALIDYPGGD